MEILQLNYVELQLSVRAVLRSLREQRLVVVVEWRCPLVCSRWIDLSAMPDSPAVKLSINPTRGVCFSIN